MVKATETEKEKSARDEAVLGFEQGKYPYKTRLARKTYEAEIAALQVELLKVQHWVQETGQKFILEI